MEFLVLYVGGFLLFLAFVLFRWLGDWRREGEWHDIPRGGATVAVWFLKVGAALALLYIIATLFIR